MNQTGQVLAQDKKLGLWALIALVTGNIVGSGAFLLPAELARIGSVSLIALLVTSVGALALALVFVRMNELLPQSGGPYVYVKPAFGDYMAFQTVYFYWIGGWIGNAAIVVAALGYLSAIFPLLNQTVPKVAAMMLLVWLPILINVAGMRFFTLFECVIAVLKFLPLFLIAICGWRYFNLGNLTSSFNVTGNSNWQAFSLAITVTLWLFIGVESATVPSDKTANPKRNIPRATIYGTLIAAVVYLLSNAAIMGMFPLAELANMSSPFATAAKIILGDLGTGLVVLGAVISCFGALLGWSLVAAEVPCAAALHDGYFPRFFAYKNRAGIPVTSLIITATLTMGLLLASTTLDLIEQFGLLILVATAAEVLAYFYTSLAEIILNPGSRRSKMTLLGAVLAALYSGYALIGAGFKVLVALLLANLLTLPLYAIFKRVKCREGL